MTTRKRKFTESSLSVEELLSLLERKSKSLALEQRLRLRSILKQAQEKSFVDKIPQDLWEMILRAEGTTTGLPKRLSTLSKHVKETIDGIFEENIQAKRCDFLTDDATGCARIPMDSKISTTCRDYCLEKSSVRAWLLPWIENTFLFPNEDVRYGLFQDEKLKQVLRPSSSKSAKIELVHQGNPVGEIHFVGGEFYPTEILISYRQESELTRAFEEASEVLWDKLSPLERVNFPWARGTLTWNAVEPFLVRWLQMDPRNRLSATIPVKDVLPEGGFTVGIINDGDIKQELFQLSKSLPQKYRSFLAQYVRPRVVPSVETRVHW